MVAVRAPQPCKQVLPSRNGGVEGRVVLAAARRQHLNLHIEVGIHKECRAVPTGRVSSGHRAKVQVSGYAVQVHGHGAMVQVSGWCVRMHGQAGAGPFPPFQLPLLAGRAHHAVECGFEAAVAPALKEVAHVYHEAVGARGDVQPAALVVDLCSGGEGGARVRKYCRCAAHHGMPMPRHQQRLSSTQ
jgi:hypothetical protein